MDRRAARSSRLADDDLSQRNCRPRSFTTNDRDGPRRRGITSSASSVSSSTRASPVATSATGSVATSMPAWSATSANRVWKPAGGVPTMPSFSRRVGPARIARQEDPGEDERDRQRERDEERPAAAALEDLPAGDEPDGAPATHDWTASMKSSERAGGWKEKRRTGPAADAAASRPARSASDRRRGAGRGRPSARRPSGPPGRRAIGAGALDLDLEMATVRRRPQLVDRAVRPRSGRGR